MNRYWLAFLLGMMLAIFPFTIKDNLIAIRQAFGHDHGNPQLNEWFHGLTNSAGYSCCDGSDATRLDDVDWDSNDGHFKVRLEGKWIDVPDSAVIKRPNLAGPTMVWPIRTWVGTEPGYTIRCFIPGTMG